MKKLLTILPVLALAFSAFGQTQGTAARATNGVLTDPTVIMRNNNFDVNRSDGSTTLRVTLNGGVQILQGTLNANGANVTNLAHAPVTVAGVGISIATNTVASTGQKTFTVTATGTNVSAIVTNVTVRASDGITVTTNAATDWTLAVALTNNNLGAGVVEGNGIGTNAWQYTNSNLGSVGTTTGKSISTNLIGDASGFTNINGANIQDSTITSNKLSADTLAMFGTGGSGGTVQTNYKSYRATLTQRGVGAPVATVLENTFGVPFVWTYAGSPGTYRVTATNAFATVYSDDGSGDNFSETNLFITGIGQSIGISGGSGTAYYAWDVESTNSALVYAVTSLTSFSLADDALTRSPIEISVYPAGGITNGASVSGGGGSTGSSLTGMRTNQFTTNVIGAPIHGNIAFSNLVTVGTQTSTTYDFKKITLGTNYGGPWVNGMSVGNNFFLYDATAPTDGNYIWFSTNHAGSGPYAPMIMIHAGNAIVENPGPGGFIQLGNTANNQNQKVIFQYSDDGTNTLGNSVMASWAARNTNSQVGYAGIMGKASGINGFTELRLFDKMPTWNAYPATGFSDPGHEIARFGVSNIIFFSPVSGNGSGLTNLVSSAVLGTNTGNNKGWSLTNGTLALYSNNAAPSAWIDGNGVISNTATWTSGAIIAGGNITSGGNFAWDSGNNLLSGSGITVSGSGDGISIGGNNGFITRTGTGGKLDLTNAAGRLFFDGTNATLSVSGGITTTAGGITNLSAAPISSASGVVATNFFTSVPKWIDAMGQIIPLATGSGALTIADSGDGTYAYQFARITGPVAYGTEKLPFNAEAPHTLAQTNATYLLSNTNLYVEPHFHGRPLLAPVAPNTNIAFRIIWKALNPGRAPSQTFTNNVTYGLTAGSTNEVLVEFQHTTYATNQPDIATVWTATITTQDPGSNQYMAGVGAGFLVRQPSFHVPVGLQNAIGGSADAAP